MNTMVIFCLSTFMNKLIKEIESCQSMDIIERPKCLLGFKNILPVIYAISNNLTMYNT